MMSPSLVWGGDVLTKWLASRYFQSLESTDQQTTAGSPPGDSTRWFRLKGGRR